MNALFKRYPLAANLTQTGLLMAVGDVIAQNLTDTKPHDYNRTLRAFSYGMIFAPMGMAWYPLVAKITPTSSKYINTVCRVAVDQLVFAPVVAIPMYYSAMTAMEGKRPVVAQIRHKLEEKWWPTLKDNWKVWPLFQVVNFFYVPVHYRLLAVNVVLLFWNTYLLWQNNRPSDTKVV